MGIGAELLPAMAGGDIPEDVPARMMAEGLAMLRADGQSPVSVAETLAGALAKLPEQDLDYCLSVIGLTIAGLRPRVHADTERMIAAGGGA